MRHTIETATWCSKSKEVKSVKFFWILPSPISISFWPLATHYDRIFIEDSLEVARHRFAVVAGDIAIEKIRALHPTIDLDEVENNIVELKKCITIKCSVISALKVLRLSH